MILGRRIQNLTPSPTMAIDGLAKEMLRQGLDVVSFSAGEPDFDTPEFIKEAARSALAAGKTKYTAVAGVLELREAIARKLRVDNGLEYSPAEIVVTNGAKQAIYEVLLAVCDEGDEVLIPAPFWVSYPEQVKLAGARPIFIPTEAANDYKVRPEDVLRFATAATRLLILNSPGNPTGSVYSREELSGIAEVCKSLDLLILSDEIYEYLIYEGEHVSIASLGGDVRERTIVVNGLSKAYAMTGWRVGYVAAPRPITTAVADLQSHISSNANTIAQWASVAALTEPNDAVVVMREEFRRRRDLIVERLTALPGFQVRRPAGAFYVFPDVAGLLGRSIQGTPLHSADALAEVFLREARVAVVPGTGFGAPACIRLSYATSVENIEKGLDRLGLLLRDLG